LRPEIFLNQSNQLPPSGYPISVKYIISDSSLCPRYVAVKEESATFKVKHLIVYCLVTVMELWVNEVWNGKH
jgi:hypothetical protein